MSAAITLEVLPARLGDCLLVECHREGAPPWRMLVDGGPADCWPALRTRLNLLPADQRHIDVAVVTHIDSDHIGGMLPLLEHGEAEVPGLTIHDVWFNGLPQLPDTDTSASRSVSQGEDLLALLGRDRPGAPYSWNAAFGRAAVMTPDKGATRTWQVPDDGPQITILSPTPHRLAILRAHWLDVLERLQRGGPDDDLAPPPVPPAPLTDVPALAARKSTPDTSKANGSSIAFLLEHRGASVLLTGDGFSNVLSAALRTLAVARGVEKLRVDAVKLPHHGSRANVTVTLDAQVAARSYVVSTNGDTFDHPDDEALARVVVGGVGRQLWFNYPPNARTARWADEDLQRTLHFTTTFAATAASGVVLNIPIPGHP